MTQLTCLLIKPKPSTPRGQLTQQQDIQNIIETAILAADLKMIGSHDGHFIDNNISQKHIRELFDADVVVIDANCYENESLDDTKTVCRLSPFLYYLMGVHHALSNRTILVSASRIHLPSILDTDHMLVYERTVAGPRQFLQHFVELIKQIKEERDQGKPGNPVQSYQREKEQLARDEELARERARSKALEDDLARKEKELKEERDSKRPSTIPQPITFRPIGKKE